MHIKFLIVFIIFVAGSSRKVRACEAEFSSKSERLENLLTSRFAQDTGAIGVIVRKAFASRKSFGSGDYIEVNEVFHLKSSLTFQSTSITLWMSEFGLLNPQGVAYKEGHRNPKGTGRDFLKIILSLWHELQDLAETNGLNKIKIVADELQAEHLIEMLKSIGFRRLNSSKKIKNRFVLDISIP